MNACKPFVLFALLSFYFPVSGQISIDRNDMPDVGDTIRYNVSYTTNGYNYKQTGSDHNWDFSFLSSIFQIPVKIWD